jgi:uncharacterized delta-60 repeat protein
MSGHSPNLTGLLRRLVLAVGFAATLVLAASAAAAPGELDASFDTDGLVTTNFPSVGSERADALALQADGKLVAAGSAGAGSSRFGLARYNGDGTLDSTFDGDGLVLTAFPESGSADANALAVQPDGKLVAAGGVGFIPSGFAVARYNADGSLDSSFGGDGRVVTGYPPTPGGFTFSPARGLVLQPDGKIVVAGNTTIAGDCRFALARYNADGTPDANFDGDGLATGPTFIACEANALVLRTDGKLVVAGSLANNPFGSERVFGLARFNPDGSLDPTFDGDGIAIANFVAALSEGATALVLQPDGKLVATGLLGAGEGFGLARFEPNGALDATFDDDGVVITGQLLIRGNPLGLVLQPDGKLVAAGFAFDANFESRFVLARYETDGDLDPTFHADGIVETDFPSSTREFATSVVYQSDGRLVAAGMGFFPFADGIGGFALARYQGDTPPDVTPPVITVPTSVSVDATGPSGAVVAYAASAMDDVDGSVLVTCMPASGSTFPIGTTSVTCSAEDAAGNEATVGFDVHVRGADEQLDLLIEFVTPLGPGTSLADKLLGAKSDLQHGDLPGACEKLNAFSNQVQPQSGKKLTAEQADELIAASGRIRTVLEC